jgi:integrase
MTSKVWRVFTKQAGIKLNPHKARHWFVTYMLRGIYEQSDQMTVNVSGDKNIISLIAA